MTMTLDYYLTHEQSLRPFSHILSLPIAHPVRALYERFSTYNPSSTTPNQACSLSDLELVELGRDISSGDLGADSRPQLPSLRVRKSSNIILRTIR
jgi:hypothetical protein